MTATAGIWNTAFYDNCPYHPGIPATDCTCGGGLHPPGLIPLSQVDPEKVEWLWPGRLPAGKLVVIDGDPSTGKSTLTLDLAARVSSPSGQWPDGTHCPFGHVLLLSAEDGIADTIVPRLIAAHADLNHVAVLDKVRRYDDETGAERMAPPSLPRDLAYIKATVENLGTKLVIVDVLMAFLSGKVDSHRDQDVRTVLAELASMAEDTGCTVILVRHMNKAGGSNALYRGGGSIGIVGAARSAFLVARDPEDESRRIFAVTKSNLGPEPPALAYRLVTTEHDCARVEWEDGTVDYTASQLLQTLNEEEASERSEAERWLIAHLSEQGGTAEAGAAVKAAGKDGITKSTLDRARRKLGVVSSKAGMNGGWVWSLPDSLPEDPTKIPKISAPTSPGSSGSSVGSSAGADVMQFPLEVPQ